MSNGSSMGPRCEWGGCKSYAAPRGGLTKFCIAHLTIITFHGWRDEEIRSKVIGMGGLNPYQDAPPVTRDPLPVEGHIYFLLSDNAVKIGWTSDLERRMKAYSPGTKILAVMPGTRKDETRMHRKFAHLRTNRREWFAYAPQVMEEVDRIVKEHGEPPRDLNEPMTTTKIVGPRLTNYIGGDRHPYGTARAKTVRG